MQLINELTAGTRAKCAADEKNCLQTNSVEVQEPRESHLTEGPPLQVERVRKLIWLLHLLRDQMVHLRSHGCNSER